MSVEARRRAGFRDGPAIRLADGRTWIFPAPPEELTVSSDPALAGLIRAVFEAEDRPDRLRCELALAIHLLSRNYDLTSAEYRTLLRFRPGSPELSQAQGDFHNMAVLNAMRLWPAAEVAPASPAPARSGWLRGLSRLWGGRRAVAGSLAASSGP